MLKHFNFTSHVKNIPALRAKGLHIVELDTRARFALVIKKESKQFFDSGLRSTFENHIGKEMPHLRNSRSKLQIQAANCKNRIANVPKQNFSSGVRN